MSFAANGSGKPYDVGGEANGPGSPPMVEVDRSEAIPDGSQDRRKADCRDPGLESRRAQRCPMCGSAEVSRYLYGLPDFSPELQKDLDEGLIILVGCTLSPNNPVRLCRTCRHE